MKMKTLTSTFIATKYVGAFGFVGDFKLSDENGTESMIAYEKFDARKYEIKEGGRYAIELVCEYGSWNIVSCVAVSEPIVVEEVKIITPKTAKQIEAARIRKIRGSLTHDEVLFEMHANNTDKIYIKEGFGDVTEYSIEKGMVVRK